MTRSQSFRGLHILCAICIGCSSFSWTVVEHYCQGERKGASLIVPAAQCHGKQAKSCCKKAHKKKDCCDDQVQLLDADQDIIKPLFLKIFDADVDKIDGLQTELSAATIHNHTISDAPIRGPCVPPDQKLRARLQVYLL